MIQRRPYEVKAILVRAGRAAARSIPTESSK